MKTNKLPLSSQQKQIEVNATVVVVAVFNAAIQKRFRKCFPNQLVPLSLKRGFIVPVTSEPANQLEMSSGGVAAR